MTSNDYPADAEAWCEVHVVSRSMCGCPLPSDPSTSGGSGRRLVATRASDVLTLPTHWLWQGRIPVGALSLLGGREGLGKSLLTSWLAAQVTRGTLPGQSLGRPRSVVIVATEDDRARTIVPRLDAAGADLRLVHFVEADTDGSLCPISLPLDVFGLERMCSEHDVALVVLDPLLSRLSSSLDTHKDADTRQALEPLSRMAASTGVSIVGLIHVSKARTDDALSSLMGSRAFSAVARAVSVVVRDLEDEDVRVFGTPKNNLGRTDLPSLLYVVEGVDLETSTGEVTQVGRLVWRGESAHNIDDLFSGSAEDREAGSDCASWLQGWLTEQGGEGARPDVLAAAKSAGFSRAAVGRAKRRLRLVSIKSGYPAKATYFLPEVAP